MTPNELLDGLSSRIREVGQVTATTDPSATVVVPMAVVTDGDITYHDTMVPRGLYSVDVVVTLYVSLADNEQGKIEARNYRANSGTNSVAGAVETSLGTDDPLDGINTIVCRSSSVGIVTSPSGEAYTAVRFEITAHIPGETA